MPKYRIWDKKSSLYPPVGPAWTSEEVFQRYGWAANPAAVVVISESGGTLQSLDNLAILKEVHGIEVANADEAVVAIEAAEKARHAAPPPPPAVSGDVAAILEAVREEGREEIRRIVREEAAKGRVDGPALDGLRQRGVLPS